MAIVLHFVYYIPVAYVPTIIVESDSIGFRVIRRSRSAYRAILSSLSHRRITVIRWHSARDLITRFVTKRSPLESRVSVPPSCLRYRLYDIASATRWRSRYRSDIEIMEGLGLASAIALMRERERKRERERESVRERSIHPDHCASTFS